MTLYVRFLLVLDPCTRNDFWAAPRAFDQSWWVIYDDKHHCHLIKRQGYSLNNHFQYIRKLVLVSHDITKMWNELQFKMSSISHLSRRPCHVQRWYRCSVRRSARSEYLSSCLETWERRPDDLRTSTRRCLHHPPIGNAYTEDKAQKKKDKKKNNKKTRVVWEKDGRVRYIARP